jgi:hypothetical protein
MFIRSDSRADCARAVIRASLLPLVLLSGLIIGCAPQGPYRTTPNSVENVAADPGLCDGLQSVSRFGIPIGYVEIDEQGYFQDRGQIDRAIDLIRNDQRRKYVVVYVHGWFHNAAETDDNVKRFKCALNNLQGIDGNSEEQVIGIYVGWRGLSWRLPLLRYLTFWERKNTSEEIGRGSLVEFLMRLERIVKPDADSPNKLMLVGHSFGASAVFNSIGQIILARFLLDAEKLLAEEQPQQAAQAKPTHSQSRPGLVSAYGDLVVLVNPAIEATRIWPFFTSLNEYTKRTNDLLSPAQPPRLIILSSEGDRATRVAFPAARVFSTLLESYGEPRIETPFGKHISLSQRDLDWHTMGNVPELQTHDPLRRPNGQKWNSMCPAMDRQWQPAVIEERKNAQRAKGEKETGTEWSKEFSGTGITLKHSGITAASNPLWIMAVGRELIADHSNISNPVMICLLDQLLGDPEEIKREGQEHQRRQQAR